MSLIFRDTLRAHDSTGLYTLQALIDGVWTDIHTISGVQSGSIEIDASLNTIPVDTSLLPVGQTFEFRWVDSLGNESNVVSALVPFALLGYFSISEDITWTNTGGDSWTFSFPYSPPSNDPGDTVNNIVNFYSESGGTTLVTDTSGVSSAQSYAASGLGAGTYYLSVEYTNTAGTHLIIAQGLVMVDGAGNVLRSAVFSGFTGVTLSGMDLSCTASYTMTNATIVSGATQYVSQDGNGANQRVLTTGSTVLTARQLPVYTTTDLFVGVYLGLDPSEWTPGLSLATNEPSCVMTLVTNIV